MNRIKFGFCVSRFANPGMIFFRTPAYKKLDWDSLCVLFQAEDGIRDWSVTGVQTCVFFFQAEDGIRDWSVTGVQTCALPILSWNLLPIRKLQLMFCGLVFFE